MPKVTLINPDDSRIDLDVEVGDSIMRAATAAGIEGIVGDCGGGMSCATCHVVVLDDAYLAKTPEMSLTEDQMLDFTAMEREPNSRLSCQLVMSEEMDGMVVRVADPQL
ncbi:2Fe-2S iron-sulfur cluster binding domain-containing protein [Pseudooceanicola sp. 216_PA32_1]|uniref:2Fe-2S iron-sulfur cluster binding domain-containing protein n=1 Tax=Pseudooceanicola pacificus TaxID=2676438 RepID=A0A844W630_9RHOB|nr:2Fe-2S iron-sulfur cluster-binding protein [Pseudooceanicola pacificus]MWB78184.1 2Fe-2S iron-sulfur cluster binding domain-containing protein [Pseudooceanicola pacificus]